MRQYATKLKFDLPGSVDAAVIVLATPELESIYDELTPVIAVGGSLETVNETTLVTGVFKPSVTLIVNSNVAVSVACGVSVNTLPF